MNEYFLYLANKIIVIERHFNISVQSLLVLLNFKNN